MRDAWFAAAEALGRSEGTALLPARAIVLKGLLETDVPLNLLAGPTGGGLGGVFAADASDDVQRVLDEHGLERLPVPSGSRAVELAIASAVAPACSVAWIPWQDVGPADRSLRRAGATRLPRGGASLLLMEDRPGDPAATCPIRAASDADLPVLVASDLGGLRDLIDVGLRCSRATGQVVALVVHASLLGEAETLELFPNRASAAAERRLGKKRVQRRPVPPESRDVLRVLRRAELNRVDGLPSPGERVPIGFVTVGPAGPALGHLVEVLALRGRVPHVRLAATSPLDAATVARILDRCEHVVVLEPRPGTLAPGLLRVAEERRREGATVASIWGERVPAARRGEEGTEPFVDPALSVALRPDDACHPSRLARRIVDLLHVIRPLGGVADALVAEPHILPPRAIELDPASESAAEAAELEDDETTPVDVLGETEGDSATGGAAGGAPGSGQVDDADDREPLPPRGRDLGAGAVLRLMRDLAVETDQWLRQRVPEPEEVAEDAPPKAVGLAVDRREPFSPSRPIVIFEAWSVRRFARAGADAVRQIARERRPWILCVCDIGRGDAADPRRLAPAAIPSEGDAAVAVREASLDDRRGLVEILREAALGRGLTVLVVGEGERPVASPAAFERRASEIDRLGFTPRQQLTWSVDRLCAPRPAPPDTLGIEGGSASSELVPSWRVDRVADRPGFRFRLRVRPLREQVVVVRSRPPVGRGMGEPRLVPPRFVHAQKPAWRVHIAGWRGAAPGLVPWILARAGTRMGYHVRVHSDSSPVAPGLRAWSQLLFTRPRHGEPPPALVGRTPFGEADLLLGVDPVETLRAVVDDPTLRVAARPTTAAIVNRGAVADDESGREAQSIAAVRLEPALEATTVEGRVILDIAAACRRRFLSDRLADVATLGVAFQRGLVPLNPDSIGEAVQAAEGAGWGRVEDAFRFGRRLALDPKLATPVREDRSEDPRWLLRRTVLVHRRRKRTEFADLLDSSMRRMPGLLETSVGRRVARDFVIGTVRCDLWGGLSHARAFADRIVGLYEADAAESGRRLTRTAVLPLSTVMLIRDPFYVAALVSGPEHRRRTRRWLDVRRARRDSLERRYLTRIELFVVDRRLRAEIRTSDWPARFVNRMRPFVEDRFRGTRRERSLRDEVMTLVDQATEEAATRREHWEEIFHRLHRMAADNRLRGMSPSELRMLVGS